MEGQLGDAWQRALERAAAQGQPVRRSARFRADDLAEAWAQCVEAVRARLVEEFGPVFVGDRFHVPDDYAVFMTTDGGDWEIDSPPWNLYPAEFVASNTILDCKVILPLMRREPVAEDGFWLVIGRMYGESEHVLYLCCDKSHSLFGAVVVGYDDAHPYLDGAPSARCRVVAPSFLEHLQQSVGFWPPDDLPVPKVERKPPPNPEPIPSHLRGWIVPVSFADKLLTAEVRCPCGCERVELHYPGKTRLAFPDRRPLPSVVIKKGRSYFTIEAVCAKCQATRVLFDRWEHGRDNFLRGSSVAQPALPLVPWPCRTCGGLAHTAELSILLDGKILYFELGYYRRFGWTRWPDAFGWIGAAIRCCECGHHETGWLSLGPGCDVCPHCALPVREKDEDVHFLPFFLPHWELLGNFEMVFFHRRCWDAWPLRQRFIRRVNATGRYTLAEDGSQVPARGSGWITTADPRPGVTLATARLEGILREACGPPLAGSPWSVQVSVDYLEEGRFIARYRVSCTVEDRYLGWGNLATVDVPDPTNRDAVLKQIGSTVSRVIESRRVGGLVSGHANTRSRAFRVASLVWTMNEKVDWPR